MDNKIKERAKQLILLGKKRGFLTHAEIADWVQADLSSRPPPPKYSYPKTVKFDAAMVEALAETLRDMGIEVHG